MLQFKTSLIQVLFSLPSSPLSSQRRPSCGGLSAEQAAIVRESREEYARRGGFVRIFPTEDSWELYG